MSLRNLAFASCLLLAACGSTPEERQSAVTVTLAEACGAYGDALVSLSPYKPFMAVPTVATVDDINATVDPICLSPEPPTDAAGAITIINAAVTRLILIRMQQEG
jgi:hypothetical protein